MGGRLVLPTLWDLIFGKSNAKRREFYAVQDNSSTLQQENDGMKPDPWSGMAIGKGGGALLDGHRMPSQ
jgi:hypothetical protein